MNTLTNRNRRKTFSLCGLLWVLSAGTFQLQALPISFHTQNALLQIHPRRGVVLLAGPSQSHAENIRLTNSHTHD